MALGSAVGGLLGGIGILGGLGGKGGKKDLNTIKDLWLRLQNSDFDFTKLTYPERQMVQQMMPEVYNAIVPDEVKLAQEQQGPRDAQVRALARIEEVAGQGLPLQDRIAAERAQGAISQEMRGRDLAVLRNLAARGGVGSGDEAQLRMAANASAGNLARDLGTSLQESALNRRMAAIGQSAGQAGALRGDDFGVAAFNADAANRFNQQVASAQTEAARYGAGARERAQGYNTETRQRLADETATGRLGLGVQQQGREDDLLSELFGQNVTRLQGLTGAYGALADWKDRDRARKEQAIAGIGKGVGGLFDVGLKGTGG